MSAALALRQDVSEIRAAEPTRDEVLSRYRQLRAISREHHSRVLKSVSDRALMQQAARLGLAFGGFLVADNPNDVNFAYDLVIHTAPAGRSRAIDRYAESEQFSPGSDQALVLEAMRRARFIVCRIERRHPIAGLIVQDFVRESELWLLDEGLEISAPIGRTFASRLFAPEGFAMTAGVLVPLTRAIFLEAFEAIPQLHRKSTTQMIDDRRFAEALYRVAIGEGVNENITYRDTEVIAE